MPDDLTPDQLDNMAVLLSAEIRSAFQLLRTQGILAVLHLAPVVVQKVEGIGRQHDLTGRDKKYLAIHIILKMVPLPWWLPMPLAEVLLDYAIESWVRRLYGDKAEAEGPEK